ncbi:hypothetical protein S83_035368, partial [Arachis hypogaea]
ILSRPHGLSGAPTVGSDIVHTRHHFRGSDGAKLDSRFFLMLGMHYGGCRGIVVTIDGGRNFSH